MPIRPENEAIYEEIHPETKVGVAGANARWTTPRDDPYANRITDSRARKNATDNLATAFSSATADATGKDERTIRRAAARGEALGDDLGAVTGTSLDKGVELDASRVAQRRPADPGYLRESANL
jgi:hypothetical protein